MKRNLFFSALFVLAMGVTAAALVARAVHFASTKLPPLIDHAVGWLMHAQLIAYMNTARHGKLLLIVGVAVPAMAALVPRWYVGRDRERCYLRTWFRSFLWSAVALANVALDVSPYVAQWCWGTLPLCACAPRRRRTTLLIGFTLTATAGFFAKSSVDVLALSVWFVVLSVAVTWVVPRMAGFDVLTALVAALGALQLAATNAPLLWEGGDGLRLGAGYAYSFCETPDHSRVLAVLPACRGGDALPDCIRGSIVEYDAGTSRELARWEPFSPNFYGRALHLLCLEDRIQLGMAQTVVHGRFQRESVIELKRDKWGERVSADLVGGAVGHRMAFDPRSESVFYVSEWSGIIHRWNRRRNEWRRDAGRYLRREGEASVSPEEQLRHASALFIAGVPMSLQTEIGAVHAARGTVFFAEWLSGSRIFEVDSNTFELRRVYDPRNGANHSLAVDAGLDRLIVSGLWGIEVFDLESGRLVARRRLGVGPRLPLIDSRHDLLYLPTTLGGGIWILDRRSYEVLGRIDVGNGGRNGLISSDGSALYGSSSRAHYRWDTATLAARFGR